MIAYLLASGHFAYFYPVILKVTMRSIILFLIIWAPAITLWAQATEPTVPVSNVDRGLQNCDEVRVDWTPGNGSARLIVMRSGAPVSELPQDGQGYTANSQYGSGSHLGNNNYVVYQGGGTAAVITGIQPGIDYHFAIFEFNGTGANANYLTAVYPSWNIPVPTPLSLNSTITNVSCFGYDDGAINLNISGGTTPYTLIWNTGDTTRNLTGLPGGQFQVTVTDSVGCTTNGTYTVEEPDQINYSLSATAVTCPGGSDGTINSQVSGGNPPFTYAWSNGATSPNIADLTAGSYTLTLTDDNGCTFSISDTVNEPDPFSVEFSAVPATCHDSEDGQLDIAASGANGGFQYAWSDGSNGNTLTNLPAGQYTLTITDSEGCTFEDTYTITAPDPIDGNATLTLVSCEGNEDGAISLAPSGGNGNYTYSWSNGSLGVSISSLATGFYDVTITDQLGCKSEESYEITVTEDPRGCLENLIIYEAFTPNGDGINEFWVIEGLENYPDNTVEIFNRWGQPVYREDNYTGQWQGTTTNGKTLPQGTYYYILTLHTQEPIQLSGDVTFLR